jgi:hypothetical protein
MTNLFLFFLAESNQELIQFNAKKESFELNIEVNDLGPVERFLRGVQ